MDGFAVSAGTVAGRGHILRQANRQDAFALAVENGYAVGVLCDGCGESAQSEVGAALGARFLAAHAARELARGILLDALPARLYGALIAYLGSLLNLQPFTEPAARAVFVRDCLLFTVLGFALTAETGVVFAAGDGLIRINDDTRTLDHGNRPPYPAYHLLATDWIPLGFEVTLLEVANLRCLGLASDGFDAALFDDLRGQMHPRAVQRRLNVWSDRERRFQDDATVIWVERKEREPQ